MAGLVAGSTGAGLTAAMTGLHPWWAAHLSGIPPHLTFDILSAVVGVTLAATRKKRTPTPLPVSVMALAGAVVGARALGLLVDPTETWALRFQLGGWMQQKTVIGGILGGWMAVELTKWRLGVTRSTADAFVVPLAVAMAVGRLGCFFSGVTDRTHGDVTDVAWAMDLGDGLPRHPLALYEIGVLVVITAMVQWAPLTAGQRWRVFVLGYMGWRFVSAPIAWPAPVLAGLTTLQLAAACGVVAAVLGLYRSAGRGS